MPWTALWWVAISNHSGLKIWFFSEACGYGFMLWELQPSGPAEKADQPQGHKCSRPSPASFCCKCQEAATFATRPCSVSRSYRIGEYLGEKVAFALRGWCLEGREPPPLPCPDPLTKAMAWRLCYTNLLLNAYEYCCHSRGTLIFQASYGERLHFRVSVDLEGDYFLGVLSPVCPLRRATMQSRRGAGLKH